MKVALFDYELPEELVAQHPAPSREAARLMVVSPRGIEHRTIADLPSLLPKDALVVVNDTRVRRARILAKKPSGGRAEIFLVRPTDSGTWIAMGRASKPFRFPSEIRVEPLVIRLEKKRDDGLLEVSLRATEGTVDEAIEKVGRVPLPPYIKREPEEADADRYQTVYAKATGAVAAPTAGLHLTEAMLARLDVASITLHVGLGTFQPVTAEDLDAHAMHAEWFEIPDATLKRLEEKRPIVAVGTTVVRALESGTQRGETRLLIQPGFEFRRVDLLLTNFHLPRSTLLALVCAFGGRERVLEAYRTAVRERYRFFSYGDAMLIHRG